MELETAASEDMDWLFDDDCLLEFEEWWNETNEDNPQSSGIPFCDKDALLKDIKFLRELGRGSFGKADLVVYKEQLCVLKTMLVGQVNLKELENMARLAGAGGAPKLVAATNDAFLSTYAGNLDMQSLISDGTTSQQFLLEGIQSIAMKMKEIHTCGLAHNDLKSDNIMYDEETGEYSIIDFGLSTPIGEQPYPVFSPFEYQRCDWIAPELKRGEPVVEASDVYSLGILLMDIVSAFTEPDYCALVAIGKATQADPTTRPSIDEFIAILKGDFDPQENQFSVMALEKFPSIGKSF